MLEIFKQQKSFLTRAKEKNSFKYVISFDNNGAFIEVCDSKLKPLKNIDYRVYNGVDREILQLLDGCKQSDFFEVSWEHESGQVYLHKHPRILELLKLSDKVYIFDNDDDSVFFKKEISIIELEVYEDGENLYISSNVDGFSDFRFLTSFYLLVDRTIVQVLPIGESFEQLKNFDTTLERSKLEEFLTILMTHFENIKIDYRGYELEIKEEAKEVTPAVIFEKITVENELVLRVSATVGKLAPEFFNDFNINKIVLINDLTKSILVYECDFSNVFELYSTIFKNLSTLKRGKKELDFSEEDGLFIINQDLAGKFILNHLHDIITKCELFGSEKLKSYKYNTSPPKLSVKFKDKIDFLDRKDVTVTINNQQFDVFDLIDLYKKHAYIPLQNGEKSIVNKEYMAKLERVFKKEGKKGVNVSFFDLPEIEEIIAKKEHKIFSDSRAFYEGFSGLKSSKSRIPKLENVTLRDYQKYGVKWLKYLYDNKFGGCLADDMGLGKTVQAITLLSYIYPKTKTPSLIVLPKSLLSNWGKELEKFNSKLSYYRYHGVDRELKELKKHHIILTTYAIVRNDIEKLKEITFDTIILDESQNIKNLDSKISKAVMLLEGEHRFALSGTPIENSMFELYSLFRFLNAGMFSTIRDFKKDYAVPIQTDSNEEVAKTLRAKISPFLLRRLKKDVLHDLPAKQEQVVYVDMDEEHKKFYEKKRDYYKKMLDTQIETHGMNQSKFVILQAFNELRQIASAPELKSDNSIVSSKVEQLFEMLEDIVSNGHKVLIFANFLGSLDLIASKADSMGIEYLMMTGSTRDRESLVEKFQTDKKYSLFLMTLKVGGVGLNLTQADYVFIFDPWWNKSAENQAIDRTHRMGQKNRVFAYKMITKGTIEEKILELQTQKQDMTDMVIGGDEGGLKELSTSDLDYILG
jgi:superfamily II DNA or RNA helicase